MEPFAKILWLNGAKSTVSPANGTDFTLQELQGIVGGHIEIVYDADRNLLVCDEEGKCKNKEINAVATAIYGNKYDVLVGNVLWCSPNYVK